MEPNKFEEHIRTQLHEREIQPSAAAWDTLDARLGASKSNNKTLWYAIAASLVAILVVGSFLVNNETPVSKEIVFEAPQTQNQENEQITNTMPIQEDTKVLDATKVYLENSKENILPKKTEENTQLATTKAIQKNKNTSKKVPNKALGVIEENTTLIPIKNIAKNDVVQLKVEEVVAQVKKMNADNTQVTAQDIEALLVKAQQDIATQRILKQATTKIDPASLLNDVESELEQSFRNKVFDALGEGFNKVRTAVVERNN